MEQDKGEGGGKIERDVGKGEGTKEKGAKRREKS